MELSQDKMWTPKEWESHVNDLLRERYTSADYIKIPDQHFGDGGIEGFSMDGHAYQMFCPENATTMTKLYNDQRNKMTRDIGKFINNTKKMIGFFGTLKIKRWILVVPEHKTKEIVIHATKKTDAVKKANLSYVNNSDFRVLVWDRNEFKKEEANLLSAGIATLKLEPIDVPEHEIEGFQGKLPEFTENLKRKLGKLNKDPVVIKKGQDTLTRSAIISQNMLSELKQDYGEFYEQITRTAAKRAKQLYIEALDSDPEIQKISYQIQILLGQLQSACKLHGDNLDEISTGTVADWLMNCTLDFN